MADDAPIIGAVFVAGGEDGLRTFSRDGITWTHVQTDKEGVLAHFAAFANGHCAIAARFGGDNVAFSTSDGVKWERVKLEGQPYGTRLDMLWVEDGEFKLMTGASEKTWLAKSKDGAQWSPRQALFENKTMLKRDTLLRRCALGSGLLCTVGDYGTRVVRKGAAWTAMPDPKAKDTLIDIAFGNGAFVGGGMHGLRMRSEDGLTWTDRTEGEEGEHINAMIWDGKQFVGIGQGATYLSPDGKTWKREPNENAPTLAAFGDGIFIGSLWPGKVMRSTDGIRWKQVHQFEQHALSFAHGRLGPS